MIFFLFFAIFPSTAFAYLDPGTGSMLVQGLVAAIAAIGTTATYYRQKVKIFFDGLIKKTKKGKK